MAGTIIADRIQADTGTGSVQILSNTGTTVATFGGDGQLRFVAGSASVPAIAPAGDLNTGIFFPAADTIAFTEGGAESMRLDASGNMGLGVTPSPWALSGSTAFQVRNAALAGFQNRAYLFSNAYFNAAGSSVYIASDFATAYEQSSGAHQWSTAPSGTAGNVASFTRTMTLDSSGRLLIGDTTSRGSLAIGQAQLQIGSASFSTFGMFGNANNTDGSYISLNKARGGTLGGTTAVQSGDIFGGIFFEGYNGTGFATGAHIYAKVDGTVSGSQMPGRLEFYTTPAGSNSSFERARITAAGTFMVGGTTLPGGIPLARFYVEQASSDYSGAFYSTSSTAGQNYGIAVFYQNAAPNNTSNEMFIGRDNAQIRFQVRSNGGIANYQANNVNLSDRREKTNFAPAKNYLDVICAIPVQTFNYIDQNMEEDPGETLGVVAQDVEAVAPELIMESNWGTKEDPKMRLSIYQTDLQYALMKCIQELKAELDATKAEIAALKGNA